MNAPESRARLLPLPPVFPFAWAVAYGEDRCGLWQAFEVDGVRQAMRWIPPGRFLMGSPESEPERWDNERLHLVTLTRGFWLAETACTQALWAAVMEGERPSGFRRYDEAPVERVSWNDVVERFLPALNARMRELEVELPTEAQWEHACRAGTQTAFWFGGQIDSGQVNFDGNNPLTGGRKSEWRERTVSVKALPANGWGLYQMHGNVWEWCADQFVPYPEGEAIDPMGRAKAPPSLEPGALASSRPAARVVRGGCWFLDARYCRSACRRALDPWYRDDIIGFRLARGPC